MSYRQPIEFTRMSTHQERILFKRVGNAKTFCGYLAKKTSMKKYTKIRKTDKVVRYNERIVSLQMSAGNLYIAKVSDSRNSVLIFFDEDSATLLDDGKSWRGFMTGSISKTFGGRLLTKPRDNNAWTSSAAKAMGFYAVGCCEHKAEDEKQATWLRVVDHPDDRKLFTAASLEDIDEPLHMADPEEDFFVKKHVATPRVDAVFPGDLYLNQRYSTIISNINPIQSDSTTIDATLQTFSSWIAQERILSDFNVALLLCGRKICSMETMGELLVYACWLQKYHTLERVRTHPSVVSIVNLISAEIGERDACVYYDYDLLPNSELSEYRPDDTLPKLVQGRKILLPSCERPPEKKLGGMILRIVSASDTNYCKPITYSPYPWALVGTLP